MTARTKKNESKPEIEPKTESKPVKATENTILLATFKDIASLSAPVYAGFKAHLNANDEDKFKESELKKKLDEYQNKNAFIKKE